jgi:hypothetical protein
MDKTLHDTDLNVVDLGDAKEQTMGTPAQVREEENTVSPYKFDA